MAKLNIRIRTNALAVGIFFFLKKRCEDHMKNFSSVPGVLYRFESQNLITFQGNHKFIGDLPFVTYFDFETTTTAKGSSDRQDSKI